MQTLRIKNPNIDIPTDGLLVNNTTSYPLFFLIIFLSYFSQASAKLISLSVTKLCPAPVCFAGQNKT